MENTQMLLDSVSVSSPSTHVVDVTSLQQLATESRVYGHLEYIQSWQSQLIKLPESIWDPQMLP